jgi:hypothetical protein
MVLQQLSDDDTMNKTTAVGDNIQQNEMTRFSQIFHHIQTQLCRMYYCSYAISSIDGQCWTQLFQSTSSSSTKHYLTWSALHLSTENAGRLLSLTQTIQCRLSDSECEDTVCVHILFYNII